MEKILFIGNFELKKHQEYLDYILSKYSDDFDICVSGRNINNVKGHEISKDRLVKKTSEIYSVFLFCAQIVIVLDDITNFKKYKNNQRVIFITSNNVMKETQNKKEFLDKYNAIYNYSDYIVFNENNSNLENFGEINIINFTDKFDDVAVKDVFNKINITKSNSILSKEILVICDNITGLIKSQNNINNIINEVKRYEDYNLIALPLNNLAFTLGDDLHEKFSSIIHLTKNSKHIHRFLNTFEGIIIYESDMALSQYNTLLSEYDLKDKSTAQVDLQNTKLLFGCNDLISKLLNINIDKENSIIKYRQKLDNIYSSRDKEKKISIIICNYNTPTELLYRSIDSAFASTHENIEVMVIDDGSKVSIEEAITLKYSSHGDKFVYIYKDNEGLGLSRNFGVKKCSGDYVFFLDSDDTIEKNGLKHMLTHMLQFELELVIGKRMICNEKGQYYNESLNYLYGQTYLCYFNDEASNIYNDQMPNNKLVKKDAFTNYDLWFEKGFYEDAFFTAKMFSRISEYHCLNIHIHNWYKYGDETTISSSKSYSNFLHKLNALEMAWSVLPEFIKQQRLKFNIISDFRNYYQSFEKYSEIERRDFFASLKCFFEDKRKYYDELGLDSLSKLIVKSLDEDRYDIFEHICLDFSNSEKQSDEVYDNYIIHTQYHLYVAILYALDSKKPKRLFINEGFLKFERDQIKKIKELDLFDDIVIFTNGNVTTHLMDELENRSNEADTIIPTILYQKFKVIFEKCNTDDYIYFFRDYNPYWYFVERHFKNLIKLEDAFDSFKRETELHNLTGIWGGIEKYVPDYYPLMNSKSAKISKIIVSLPIEGLDNEYNKKIIVQDTRELERKYEVEIREILNKIYKFKDNIPSDSIILLTQPLAYMKYCTKREQLYLYESMIRGYDIKKIIIKPHPADNLDYKKFGFNVADKKIPIEVYNINNIKVDKAITFGSSSINSLNDVGEKIIFFKFDGFVFDDVTTKIREIISKNKTYILRNRILRILKKRLKR